MSAAPTVLDLGTPASSVADVEYLLGQLRRRAIAQGRESSTPARTAVLTVVVHATRRVHAERAARTVGILSDRHPSRLIVLFNDEAGREAFDADVSLQCHLPQASARELCYEQVVVRVRGDVSRRLPSIVIPLLLSDLPVFLWWTGTPPLDAPHFRQLLRLADRLIVDSKDFARPAETLGRLADIARGGGAFGVTDLTWTRLTGWRELLAQLFDVPEWRPFLDAVTGVRFGFAVDPDGRGAHASQALLYLGWLAARLGWRTDERIAPSEAGGNLFRMRRADGEAIWVRLRPRFVKGVEEGNVTGVRVLCDLAGRHAEFVLKRDGESTPHVSTEVIVDGASAMRRTLLLPSPSVVELLGEELTIAGSDTVYEEALAALCALT